MTYLQSILVTVAFVGLLSVSATAESKTTKAAISRSGGVSSSLKMNSLRKMKGIDGRAMPKSYDMNSSEKRKRLPISRAGGSASRLTLRFS